MVSQGKRVEWLNLPSQELAPEVRLREIIWIVLQFWRSEQSHLQTLIEAGKYNAFKRMMGGVLITTQLVAGVEGSMRRLYQNLVPAVEIDVAQSGIDAIKVEVKKFHE